MPWPCFWVEEAPEQAVYLRRYTSKHEGGWTCENGWHEAKVFVGEVKVRRRKDGYRMAVSERRYARDARWPKKCDGCDYRFNARRGDVRQVFTQAIYVNPLTGERHFDRELPPGALYDAWWLPDGYRGADGIHLACVLPRPFSDEGRGVMDAWFIDGPSSSGGRWTRTGGPHDIPNLSVSPSILSGQAGSERFYHSYLTNGALGDHIG